MFKYYYIKSIDSYWDVREARFLNSEERLNVISEFVTYIDDVEVLKDCLETFKFPKGEFTSIEERQKELTDSVQKYLDSFVQSRGYDNVLSTITYITSTVPQFKLEAQYVLEARDKVWLKANELLDDVMKGRRSIPTIEEVLTELPVLEWPLEDTVRK
jgi:division protein CdvB (Snf7/Vps24/ESCRT-III family)